MSSSSMSTKPSPIQARSKLDGARLRRCLTLNRHFLEAVEYIMSGSLELPVHHDVVEAVEALSCHGARVNQASTW